MSIESVLSDKKFRWISQMYFHVADNSILKVNPFQDLSDFLQARVGDLAWGKDHEARQHSKERFINHFERMIHLYNYQIPGHEVRNCILNDDLSNYEMVQKLINAGKFND
jgi:hypothetical protein